MHTAALLKEATLLPPRMEDPAEKESADTAPVVQKEIDVEDEAHEECEDDSDHFHEPSFLESLLAKRWRTYSKRDDRIRREDAVRLMLSVAQELNLTMERDLEARLNHASKKIQGWRTRWQSISHFNFASEGDTFRHPIT